MSSAGVGTEVAEAGCSYDTEISALHELVARMVTLLLEVWSGQMGGTRH
jgi:hypothetical protein